MSINSVTGNTVLESGFFPPVRVATTGAGIALTGLQTVDGVALAAGDRVLVKDQADPTANGIYAASTGNWVRTSDAAGNAQFFSGMAVLAALGARNAGVIFACTCADDPVVVGTSLLTFAVVAGSLNNAATSSTSLTVGTGAKTLTIQSGKSFAANQWILIWETSAVANVMLAQVTSYSGASLVVNATAVAGSGTHTDWSVGLVNSPATAGLLPPAGTGNVGGPGSSTTGHVAAFADTTGKLLQDGGAIGACAALGIGAFLGTDGSGNLTPKLSALLGNDGSGNLTIAATGITATSYVRPAITVNASGQITAIANGTQPTRQIFTSGSGTYNTPAGCKRLAVRMVAGGGSSGGSAANGNAGADSIFNAIHATGGGAGSKPSSAVGGAGGAGGSSGAGSAALRISGQDGGDAPDNSGSVNAVGGIGGSAAFFGGGGAGSRSLTAGKAPQANTGAGGSGAAAGGGSGGAGGGAAGEYAEIVIAGPASTYAYTVGAAGAAVANGAAGAAGQIIVDEFYD